ncbi:YfhL family 4Fe-4S dicluster ferredoxin [Anaerophaga thermohalophila]|jgi:ferredoxin|uniref:YfhL family 4Fe-4S dicluster ferredoxin n=1 Tax=Anaerophaga thermohalophila TaxID=177400 RepID=UPI0003174380|nr:YfhL family 4Fe-4S dicluster ferredoxin [Anaerophaga thermohalophila]
MALKITDDCISCGVCVAECPNDAISEGDSIFVINPDRCTECVGFFDEPQCVNVCPVDAIVPDPEHEETKEQLMEKKKKLHGA